MKHYDVVICGGGLVGRSLAVSLAKLKLSIAVLEAAFPSATQHADFDCRSFAISYGNSQLLTELGIWQKLKASQPISTIHVSDRGHAGITRLRAHELSVPALGYIVLAPDLNLALQESVTTEKAIDFLCPAVLTDISFDQDKAIVSYQQQQQLSASLVVAADGAHSSLRQLLQISTEQSDYGQTAVIANIGLARGHGDTAYERFTATGPLALLPLSEQRCGLVWTLTPELANKMLEASDAEFLGQLQRAFGYRLGRFIKVGKRFAYPLQLIRAKQLVCKRAVLVGNAAHTLHPVAGQGFNLGLRDVVALTQSIIASSYDVPTSLQAYAAYQAQDHTNYIRLTDGLIKLFANNYMTHITARNLGLNALNFLPYLKTAFARRAMGFISSNIKSYNNH